MEGSPNAGRRVVLNTVSGRVQPEIGRFPIVAGAFVIAGVPWVALGPRGTALGLALESIAVGMALYLLGRNGGVAATIAAALLGIVTLGIGTGTAGVAWNGAALAVFAAGGIALSFRGNALSDLQRGSMDAEEQLRSQLSLTLSITRNLREGVFVVDGDGHISYVNPAAEQLLGWSHVEIVGQAVHDLVHPDHTGRDCVLMPAVREGCLARVNEESFARKDGTPCTVDYVSTPVHVRGIPAGAVIAFHAVVDRKRVQDLVQFQALHDALTGLPNRTLLFDRLDQSLLRARREQGTVGLLLLDIDHLKSVNDRYGQRRGDLLLEQVGKRLRGVLRESDTVCRLGGDEFAVLLHEADERGAAQTAKKVLEALDLPFTLDGRSVTISAVAGTAVFPVHGEGADDLFQHADIDMYLGKQALNARVS